MPYPNGFLTIGNFELAFRRVLNSGDGQYKQFYSHLLPAYELALRENVRALIDDLRKGNYTPSKSTVIYLPKKSGVLHPISLLSVTDPVVYQAIVNIVANSFHKTQQKHANVRSFGAIYAGRSSVFFFRPWKVTYRSFNTSLTAAFNQGADYFAEFDLVSCYELVDHTLLKSILLAKVRNPELIELLFDSLRAWTGHSTSSLGHGLPQGPEPSAFLAECLLFSIDKLQLKGATCLRFIDDIKLLSTNEGGLRRALLRLDLASKALGLVPQAQKITLPYRVKSVDEILKTVPSLSTLRTPSGKISQRSLFATLQSSMRKQSGRWIVEDVTKFKFTLFRLNPRSTMLPRLARLLVDRPDMSPSLSEYFRKFPRDRVAANFLYPTLKIDPVYDLAAANYIEAMDVCEPRNRYRIYRDTIAKIHRQSEEKSILLPIASGTFFGRRGSSGEALRIISRVKHPLVKGLLLHRLFGDAQTLPSIQSRHSPLWSLWQHTTTRIWLATRLVCFFHELRAIGKHQRGQTLA